MALNYFEHFLSFVSAIVGCVLMYAFTSLDGVPVGIASSAAGSKSLQSLREKSLSQLSKKRGKNTIIYRYYQKLI